jgi:hypothetical protein
LIFPAGIPANPGPNPNRVSWQAAVGFSVWFKVEPSLRTGWLKRVSRNPVAHCADGNIEAANESAERFNILKTRPEAGLRL